MTREEFIARCTAACTVPFTAAVPDADGMPPKLNLGEAEAQVILPIIFPVENLPPTDRDHWASFRFHAKDWFVWSFSTIYSPADAWQFVWQAADHAAGVVGIGDWMAEWPSESDGG